MLIGNGRLEQTLKNTSAPSSLILLFALRDVDGSALLVYVDRSIDDTFPSVEEPYTVYRVSPLGSVLFTSHYAEMSDAFMQVMKLQSVTEERC